MKKFPSIIQINEKLLESAKKEKFSGHDPFDFLNSSFFNSLPIKNIGLIRLAWLQLGKRSPINLRKLVGVPKMRNPKGVALYILGMLEDYSRTGDVSLLDGARDLGDWLIKNKSNQDEWDFPCWGYHFDWQARAFFVPAGKPNMITTYYVSRALYNLGKTLKNDRFINESFNSAKFVSKYLFTKENKKEFYAYIPGESALVHNASLWGASWCGFVGKKIGDDKLINQSLNVARNSVDDQNLDGSWVYGSRHHHNFIDGFHTGYNLEALKLISDDLEISDFDESISRGYKYYLENLFDYDGNAKYYNNSVFPLDMHSFSQAIFTILKVGGKEEDVIFCKKVVEKAISMLYLNSKNRFAYQKNKFFQNNVNYSRWTQAWSYYSLAFFIKTIEAKD